MNRLSSERASKPSNLLRERLDGFDALSEDKRFIQEALAATRRGTPKKPFNQGGRMHNWVGRQNVPLLSVDAQREAAVAVRAANLLLQHLA